MLAAKEPAVGGKGAGVGCGKYQMTAVRCHQGLFFDGETAPEQKHQVFPHLRNPLDDGVGELLPADSRVACGHVGPYRQGGIQEQNSLLGPAFQVPVRRRRKTKVVVEFLEDVDEGGGRLDSHGHREAQAVGLSRIVVGVLPDNHRLHLFHRAKVQGGKNLGAGRVNHVPAGLFLQKGFLDFLKIGLLELVAQKFEPGFFQLDHSAQKLEKSARQHLCEIVIFKSS